MFRLKSLWQSGSTIPWRGFSLKWVIGLFQNLVLKGYWHVRHREQALCLPGFCPHEIIGNGQGAFAAHLFTQSLWEMQYEKEPGVFCCSVSWPGDRNNRAGTQSCSLGDSFSFLTAVKITVQHNVKSQCTWSAIKLFGSFRWWSDGYILFTKIKRTKIKKALHTDMWIRWCGMGKWEDTVQSLKII